MNKNSMIEWLRSGSIAIPKLLLQNYHRLGLNEKELVMIIHFHSFIESGVKFPPPTEIAARMAMNEDECMSDMHRLVQRRFLAMKDDGNITIFSLTPLWEQLANLLVSEVAEKKRGEQQQAEINMYSLFEAEFGRSLSPLECEKLVAWLEQDEHDPIIVKLALQEAVLSGKMSFKYIDSILLEWKKNGVKTAEQAKERGRKFRQSQRKSDESSSEEYVRTVPFYNWLEE